MRIIDSPDFTKLPGDVAALLEKSGERNIFDHPAWYDVVARRGLPRGTHLRLITDDEAKAGLVVTGRNRHLALCSTPYTCLSAPLHVTPDAIEAFMAELA